MALDMCRHRLTSLVPHLQRHARPQKATYLTYRALSSSRDPFLKVTEEVEAAIHAKKPVVALESAIYTHGFPYPENTALASHLESVVRVNGGIPATVGILNGVARVGFEAEELIELTASAGKPGTRKVSRRDLGYICGTGYARKFNGGTTISGTMVLASLAGINVFATGGLGGVHRGGETTMDISADLTELGRTRMTVISSGCKSFLDLSRTLEVLETQGVGVATFSDGRTGDVDFPAFWTRDSGIRSPLTITNEEEAASISFAQMRLNINSGLLFANPIPAEYSIPKEEMNAIIAQAVREAEEAHSKGSDNTPFVLKRIRELTNGGSVTANRALVEANVVRGTRVAAHLSQMERDFGEGTRTLQAPWYGLPTANSGFFKTPNSDTSSNSSLKAQDSSTTKAVDVIVAGSLAVDLCCDFIPPKGVSGSNGPQQFTSNPAHITQSLGGVGRNVATAIQLLGVPVRLCTSVASDAAGSTAIKALAQAGMQTSGIRIMSTPSHRTAQYIAMNDSKKNLMMAMADMDILEHGASNFDAQWKICINDCKPKWLVVDANWNGETIRKWMKSGKAAGAKVAFEPVSGAKAGRLFAAMPASESNFETFPNHTIDLATPNTLELAAMYNSARDIELFEREDWFWAVDAFGLPSSGSRTQLVYLTNNTLVDEGVPQQSIQLLPFIPCILTTLGKRGVLLTQLLHKDDERLTSPSSAPYILSRTKQEGDIGGIYMRLFGPAEKVPNEEIVSVNGAGDTLLGTIIAGLSKSNSKSMDELIGVAQRASVISLKSKEAVSPAISILQSAL